ncbi:fosfomycin resistance glutathione transferase [Klebsiella sp. BIGb0407]|uniref:fosfomycin resistance glutathione transferase n=1 Tax=Klebsiella sp. BIGb0407 TaxID=2940603 RepID=UPI0021699656|nr:fosfomycin resistance glutathione transferase [Klebsiella sp. BIGb0407]MCS3429742.1 catechol 2,3-dioxygenase-like lactoylglutathione lyase family enzyme [Klebsiella sp. BIGb0407]
MLTGLNHLTLAVSSLERSLVFYQQYLGMQCHASWEAGAYLSCGEFWLCLSHDNQAGIRRRDYTHYAFSISEGDFSLMVERLKMAGVACWKDNRSEGQSFYFLDPDNHQLELHVGTLASRLEACREKPYHQMVFYSDNNAANDEIL